MKKKKSVDSPYLGSVLFARFSFRFLGPLQGRVHQVLCIMREMDGGMEVETEAHLD